MTLESNSKLHTGICSQFRLVHCIETWVLYYYITSVFTVHHQIKGFWCTFWSRQHLLDAAFQFFIQIVLSRFHGNRLTLQSSRIVVWLCGQFICERNVYCSGCKIVSRHVFQWKSDKNCAFCSCFLSYGYFGLLLFTPLFLTIGTQRKFLKCYWYLYTSDKKAQWASQSTCRKCKLFTSCKSRFKTDLSICSCDVVINALHNPG